MIEGNDICSLKYSNKTLIVQTQKNYFYLFAKVDTDDADVRLDFVFRIKEFIAAYPA